MPTYVVGVDGSRASLSALRWTQELAKRTGASVRVISAWIIPPTDGAGVAYAMEPLQESAQMVLDRALAAGTNDPGTGRGRDELAQRAARQLIAVRDLGDDLPDDVARRATAALDRISDALDADDDEVIDAALTEAREALNE